MNCGKTPSEGSSSCGTLTVSSGSSYPEVIDTVVVSAPFMIIAGAGCDGVTLVSNACIVSISFQPQGFAAGLVTGEVTIRYGICTFDASGTTMNCSAMVKTVLISGTVTGPTTTPVDATGTTKVEAPSTTFLPGCALNVSTQAFCIVVPLQ
jgi:hypothetical protein